MNSFLSNQKETIAYNTEDMQPSPLYGINYNQVKGL